MRYAVVGLVLCSLAVAYMPGSFRWQSTAGLWEDDYDLLFEPARIPLIEGSRVYTTLSNFITSQEEQFGSRSENFFLVGGSSDLTGPVYPGVVFDKFATKTPLFTGLFGGSNDSLFGRGRQIYTELLDLDSNGTYDYKRVDVTEAEAWRERSRLDGYVGLGFMTGQLRLGAGFAYAETSHRYQDPERCYVCDRRDSSLVDARLTFVRGDTFAGFEESSMRRMGFLVGGWYDFTYLSAGLSATYAPMTENVLDVLTGHTREDRSPANPSIVDYMEMELTDTMATPYSGALMSATAQAFYFPRPEVGSWFYVTAYSREMAVDAGASGLEATRIDSVCRPGTAAGYDSTFHRYTGRRASRGIEFRTNQLFTVAEKLLLGFGVGFTTRAWEDSLTDTTAYRSYYSYDNGDTIAGREDYRTTVSSSEMWLNRATGRTNVLAFPVGFEYQVLSPLAVRFGATHTIVWRDATTNDQLIASSPRHTRTEYGDGTFHESLGEARQYPGLSEEQSSMTGTTAFTYGVGYKPIKNLQIDVMGFQRLTNLTGWSLSVTFGF